MKEQLAKIEREALEAITGAGDPAALDELRVKYLGKKGELTAVLKQMGKLPKNWQAGEIARKAIEIGQ